MKLDDNVKTEIVEVFISADFKECVMYCTDSDIISHEYEKSIMLQYNSNSDLEHEVVNNFFNFLGINDDEFLEIQGNIITF